MTRVVSVVALDETTVRRVEALPGVTLCQLPPTDAAWDAPADVVRGTHVVLGKKPPRNLDDMTDLKMLQITTVGYEHLRHLSFAGRAVRVCNARGIFDTAIGEWNLAMMIALTRDLRGMIQNQDAAVWEKDDRFQQEVRGKVVGLWGYGGIGRETARLAKAFGMTVHVLTRSGVGPRGHNYALPGTGDPEGVLPDRVFVSGQEKAFLSGLDFLVLALPHTKHSTGLVGEQQLRTLPPTAFVLNPARGPIIDEAALLAALTEGWIAGAALDTHFAYPLPPEHPLWGMSNVILTPHVSGADKSKLFPARMADLFAQNVERFVAGRPVLNEVTAAEWREA
jgi:phosphoglycerate dehydrogenase-like enzyme